MPNDILPDWEEVLSAAAKLQGIVRDAVLVGGSASAIYAKHRFSRDADHVISDLRLHFDEILAQLESVAGWKTARINRPVMILGSLDGIETGIRQLIRKHPLETKQIEHEGQIITLPTEAEILRIKAVLILTRNATRDYLDFVALAKFLGEEKLIESLKAFDQLYPQENGESALQQLEVQLANPLPYDLDSVDLSQYKNLDSYFQNWNAVKKDCENLSIQIFERTNQE